MRWESHRNQKKHVLAVAVQPVSMAVSHILSLTIMVSVSFIALLVSHSTLATRILWGSSALTEETKELLFPINLA
ncbi:hypothetical protein DAA48_25985 [Aeromonas veronii]|uniref:Uncharacterized protein n=1 Tax=Aeromonas veronii TaxID=654 RepID=A0A2T4MUK7_AERVE|nr:hypothetical protein DAA48_25985 [Aeromonas veronii]